MLTDSNLTNIYLVSGVYQIRYRVYCQSCKRSQLDRALSEQDTDCNLIYAFRHLVRLHIPCVWRALSSPSSSAGDDNVYLELWAFWFDEQRTGQIDTLPCLQALEEVKMGSFSWESTIGKHNVSPTASPSNMPSPTLGSAVSVAEEYKLFVRALQTLIHATMIQRRALPLGDSYILPDTDNSVLWPHASHDESDQVITCTYHIYLTNANLVLQPKASRHWLRSVRAADLQTSGTPVILSPSGDHATLIMKSHNLSRERQDAALQSWAALLDLPIACLVHPDLPRLVPLQTASGIMLYPTQLVFVRLEPRPSADALGEQWSRWAWTQALPMESTTNFWKYRSLHTTTISTILDSLSANATTTGILQKALSEDLDFPPFMLTKAVATPSLSRKTDEEPEAPSPVTMSVSDFALLHFTVAPKPETVPDPHLSDPTESEKEAMVVTPVPPPPLPIAVPAGEPPPPQPTQPTQDSAFGLGFDIDGYGRWDDVNDLDNIDFDVTEEDFNFFASDPKPTIIVNQSETEHKPLDDPGLMLMDMPLNEPSLDLDHLLGNDIGMLMQQSTTAPETPAPEQKQQPEECMSPVSSKDVHPVRVEPDAVPRAFAPVHFPATVNDAKYSDGGKFMYPKQSTKRDTYRPDYKPPMPKRIKRIGTAMHYMPPSPATEEPRDTATPQGKPSRDADTRSHTSNSSTSSSSSSYSSTSDSEDESDVELAKEIADDLALDWWTEALHRAQRFSIDQQLQQVLEQPVDDELVAVDISLEPGQETDRAHFQALDQLCQQVVMGGYPFQQPDLSVLEEKAEDEGSTMTGDQHQVAQAFRDVLNDLFSSEPANFDILPSGIAVKGPLSVQQYYDLSETSQTQSKYGKYQVKKRRPAEPNLDTVSPPDIVVSRQDAFLEGAPSLVFYWDKLRLEPYSDQKNISYFCVMPQNDALENACLQFFRGLSSVYEACHLGAHFPGSVEPYRRGMVPATLLPEEAGETWADRQTRSYIHACKKLGAALAASNFSQKMHITVYMVNPSKTAVSHLGMSRCVEQLRAYCPNIVWQLLPLEHVLRDVACGGHAKLHFKDIAFSVYTKCHATIHRKALYTPPFILAKPAPTELPFTLQKPADEPLTLHLAYRVTPKWVVAIWTDHRGELLEFAVRARNHMPLEAAIQELWDHTETLMYAGVQWTCVITKVGLLFERELRAWKMHLIGDQFRVAIVSVQVDSSLRLHIEEQPQPASIHDFSHTPTPGIFQSSSTTNATTAEEGEAQTLLLNHRVAYCSRFQWMLPLASGYLVQSQSQHSPSIIEFHLVHNQTSHSAYHALRDIIKQHHALSFVSLIPSHSILPVHILLSQRLERILSLL
ncbi:mediator complex subunit 13 C-terminal-domain-containing protein [Syncephalastrum racemosum]|uniref:Mediator of RNA polymerase II transcription subunit 13 n=1 Tax=Syncephalastrum racemosum TaxID=13706 RepID=A0A1X2HQ17_SYNRA|nr:mediator complex subunit 13 C-terminal-domain-containing protein [Syncephalastrum racemosum]